MYSFCYLCYVIIIYVSFLIFDVMAKKMKVVELEIHATDFSKFHETCDLLFLSDPDYKDWSYRAVFREAGPRKVIVQLIYDQDWKLFRLAWRFGRGV